tara:strand:+ start:202 stop:588 length:387 start_codon:yes stop_codon:yes gene_type:complete
MMMNTMSSPKKSKIIHSHLSLFSSLVSLLFSLQKVRKKKFKTLFFSLSSSAEIKIFLFNPLSRLFSLSVRKAFCSLFLGVWRHTKRCFVGVVCVPKSTLSHSHSLSHSLTLSLKNKRVQNEEEEAEED